MLLLKEQDQGMDLLGEVLTKQKLIARDMYVEKASFSKLIFNNNI